MGQLKVKKIVDKFQLEVLSGKEYLDRLITTSDLSRPGLEMAGYFTYYPADRIQILGRTELSFFERLHPQEKEVRMLNLCHEKTPCVCISRGMDAPPELLKASKEKKMPVLRSQMTTTQLMSKLTHFLETELAPQTAMHGVLVDVYGVGVLITGQSGIGKSETALELVKRGHRLVADDVVEIRQPEENELVGTAPELIRHLLEIRGVGIINVMTLFGAGAVRNYKKISMVCHLENWDNTKPYDRLGLDEQKIKIIDTYVPQITIPVRPGRNLAVIVEVAAMNFRLKRMGFNAAEHFAHRLTAAIEEHDDKHDDL
ncbi:HPr kinase [Caldalkalibacillus thermarum TA2.A1]|uniref:HPr kinase/phosphorylase n=1 Tax=Caldalkalibacillus thermarum (strain TA2.A1) TaxID=986075 RepID=F5L6V2_CALTT|nr:HPr(Ser) kinase/phosphatase [Caldalkalibacillus thermarum]EGL82938.1 HPr kinase [Caldalkalibacillus thermarum TA2.A1]